MYPGLDFSSFHSNVECGSPTPSSFRSHLFLPKSLLAFPTGAHHQPDRSASQTDCKP